MYVVRQIIVRLIGQLVGNEITSIGSQRPKIVTKHINKVCIFRVYDKTMIVKAPTLINIVSIARRNRRQCCAPSLTLIIGYENT